MGCIARVLASGVDVSFQYGKEEQKDIIEFVLHHSKYDLIDLAQILDVSPLLLCDVIVGTAYLDEICAHQLIKLLLILIGK